MFTFIFASIDPLFTRHSCTARYCWGAY